MDKRRTFIGDLWTLLRPYWTSEERRSAWLLLAAEHRPHSRHGLYDRVIQPVVQPFLQHAAGQGQGGVFPSALGVFYLNRMLQIRWRRWLTDWYLIDWLADRNYYRMQLKGDGTDNPDQRSAEDFRLFVDDSLSLGLGFLNAAVTLASFVGILWSISGPLEVPFSGTIYVIYGHMVWVAIIYAIAGTWLTHKIGQPLITLNFNQPWNASVDRLTSFQNAIGAAQGESRAGAGPTVLSDERSADLVIRNLETEVAADRLDEQQNWARQLSGGEQQRVAIARALLHRPAWLFLDEATSALDEPSQAQIYRVLNEWLKDATMISIAHRSALADFHGKMLELKPGGDGKMAITTLDAPLAE